jgi:hypothetical protein
LLDNAGAPLTLFYIVLRYIEDNVGKAFVPGCRLPRQETFLHSLTNRFAVPTHENIPVTIEIGNEPAPSLGSANDDLALVKAPLTRSLCPVGPLKSVSTAMFWISFCSVTLKTWSTRRCPLISMCQ